MPLLLERNAEITRLAYETLLACNVCALPVDMLSLTACAQVKVIDNQEVGVLEEGEYGASYFDGSVWRIVYDASMNLGRIRFTLAHELGHILLGHMPAQTAEVSSHCAVQDGSEQEEEADLFAARLLAPPCVLRALGAYAASSIRLLCNLSQSCAALQSKTMLNLLRSPTLPPTGAENALLKQFAPFIADNRLRTRHDAKKPTYRTVNTQILRRPHLDVDIAE